MSAWKVFLKALHDLARWVLRICLSPLIGALEAISKACQRLADELAKV